MEINTNMDGLLDGDSYKLDGSIFSFQTQANVIESVHDEVADLRLQNEKLKKQLDCTLFSRPFLSLIRFHGPASRRDFL